MMNGAKIGSGVIEEDAELATRPDAALSPHHTFTPPPTCPPAAATLLWYWWDCSLLQRHGFVLVAHRAACLHNQQMTVERTHQCYQCYVYTTGTYTVGTARTMCYVCFVLSGRCRYVVWPVAPLPGTCASTLIIFLPTPPSLVAVAVCAARCSRPPHVVRAPSRPSVST